MEATLTGGAVVSICTDNRHMTADLDFITLSSIELVQKALDGIGFVRSSGRCFSHPGTDIEVEFPPGPLAIGDAPVSSTGRMEVGGNVLNILTPTQCDGQALEQALLVGRQHGLDLDEIRIWSESEDMSLKYGKFLRELDIQRYT
jgi:hypothetical protein